MPKLPRISGRQAIDVLERLGFRQVRQRGSHVVLRRGAGGCVIPLHMELAVGTLRGALRQAGITPEQFVQKFEGGH
ncbi:MAG: type II toxin-antitoxin system HicA family toxin [Planctomycetota bacterium]|nr:type II toxin-antitoxin system HicA family toxin [Planctomycetota bacterium]